MFVMLKYDIYLIYILKNPKYNISYSIYPISYGKRNGNSIFLSAA